MKPRVDRPSVMWVVAVISPPNLAFRPGKIGNTCSYRNCRSSDGMSYLNKVTSLPISKPSMSAGLVSKGNCQEPGLVPILDTTFLAAGATWLLKSNAAGVPAVALGLSLSRASPPTTKSPKWISSGSPGLFLMKSSTALTSSITSMIARTAFTTPAYLVWPSTVPARSSSDFCGDFSSTSSGISAVRISASGSSGPVTLRTSSTMGAMKPVMNSPRFSVTSSNTISGVPPKLVLDTPVPKVALANTWS